MQKVIIIYKEITDKDVCENVHRNKSFYFSESIESLLFNTRNMDTFVKYYIYAAIFQPYAYNGFINIAAYFFAAVQ